MSTARPNPKAGTRVLPATGHTYVLEGTLDALVCFDDADRMLDDLIRIVVSQRMKLRRGAAHLVSANERLSAAEFLPPAQPQLIEATSVA